MPVVTDKLGSPDFNRASKKKDVKGDLASKYAKAKQNYSTGEG